MRIPFLRKRKPRDRFTVTFTQTVNADSLEAGAPLSESTRIELDFRCECGGRMGTTAVIASGPAGGYTQTIVCTACGHEMDLIYVVDLKRSVA